MAVKKRKLLVITYGGESHASSRIRALNHFKQLSDYFEIDWIPERPEVKRTNAFSKMFFAFFKRALFFKRLFSLAFNSYDLVFVQVVFLSSIELGILNFRKKKLVFDFDDAIYERSQRKFESMVVSSNAIIVSVPGLKDYLGNRDTPIFVLPSPVDTELIKGKAQREESSVFKIAWIGSDTTLVYLEALREYLNKVAKKLNFELYVVGAHFESETFIVRNIEWSISEELKVLESVDCGIMPLVENKWSPMKGGYKLYLYMAASLPVIASPIGINNVIIENGENGFLASNGEEWEAALLKLYSNKGLAHKMGEKGRLKCENEYSYKVCTNRFLTILSSL